MNKFLSNNYEYVIPYFHCIYFLFHLYENIRHFNTQKKKYPIMTIEDIIMEQKTYHLTDKKNIL